MFSRLRSKRLNHATVIAYVALFTALGGTAYAVATVTGADIVDESVTGADIKNGSLGAGDIGASAIGNPQIAPGAVTGSKIGEGAVSGSRITPAAVSPSRMTDEAKNYANYGFFPPEPTDSSKKQPFLSLPLGLGLVRVSCRVAGGSNAGTGVDVRGFPEHLIWFDGQTSHHSNDNVREVDLQTAETGTRVIVAEWGVGQYMANLTVATHFQPDPIPGGDPEGCYFRAEVSVAKNSPNAP
jgi:hypothetical protein